MSQPYLEELLKNVWNEQVSEQNYFLTLVGLFGRLKRKIVVRNQKPFPWGKCNEQAGVSSGRKSTTDGLPSFKIHAQNIPDSLHCPNRTWGEVMILVRPNSASCCAVGLLPELTPSLCLAMVGFNCGRVRYQGPWKLGRQMGWVVCRGCNRGWPGGVSQLRAERLLKGGVF